MPKDDKLTFEGFLVHKDLETQVREFGENHEREVAEAYARMDDPNMAAAQQSAYEAALADMLALAAAEVRRPVHDPRLLLNEALNYAEEVVDRRRKLQARVGHKFRVDLMLLLERYALATMHAFKIHRDNPVPPNSLPKLLQEGAERRYFLGLACNIAFGRKRQDYPLLKEVDGSMIPEAIAYDIFRLRQTLLQADPKTRGPWYANHEESAHAEQLANTLLQAATNPSMRTALAWSPTDMYARAFTLVHRACYEAELGLVALDNTRRPPDEQWAPRCIFCEKDEGTASRVHGA